MIGSDTNDMQQATTKVFIPFSEDLLAAAGSPLGELVPYQLEYRCVRLLDGTYDFSAASPALQTDMAMVHAA